MALLFYGLPSDGRRRSWVVVVDVAVHAVDLPHGVHLALYSDQKAVPWPSWRPPCSPARQPFEGVSEVLNLVVEWRADGVLVEAALEDDGALSGVQGFFEGALKALLVPVDACERMA